MNQGPHAGYFYLFLSESPNQIPSPQKKWAKSEYFFLVLGYPAWAWAPSPGWPLPKVNPADRPCTSHSLTHVAETGRAPVRESNYPAPGATTRVDSGPAHWPLAGVRCGPPSRTHTAATATGTGSRHTCCEESKSHGSLLPYHAGFPFGRTAPTPPLSAHSLSELRAPVPRSDTLAGHSPHIWRQ